MSTSDSQISAADAELAELQQRMAKLKQEKERLELEMSQKGSDNPVDASGGSKQASTQPAAPKKSKVAQTTPAAPTPKKSAAPRKPAARPKSPNAAVAGATSAASAPTAIPSQIPASTLSATDSTSAEAEHEEDDDQESVAAGKPLLGVFKSSPPFLVSMIIHMIMVIMLALSILPAVMEKNKVVITANAIEAEEMEELEELTEVEMEVEEMEELEVQDMAIATEMNDPGQIAFGQMAAAVSEMSFDANVSVADTTIGEIGALFGEDGDAFADVGEGLAAAASFFGTKSKGRKFVFVCDNSNSMGRGKFETTLDEMMKSVESMTEKQYFYVIFFSDTAYKMFHPYPADRMIKATPENKEKLRSWLYSVEMCLQTKGLEAMEAALSLRPDVIYILGDGNFTDKTQAMLCAPHDRRTTISTFGMQVNDKGEAELTNIAKANGGTFKRVNVTPLAVAAAKANPIKKNNSRGPVWGIKLGNKKK